MLFPVQKIHSNFKLSCHIDRGQKYHKISFEIQIVGNKKILGFRKISIEVCYTTRPQWSPFNNMDQ